MRRIMILVVATMLVTACAGGDGGGNGAASQPAGDEGGGEPTTATNGGNPGGGGSVIDPQPPGHAAVSVDGVEYTFAAPPLVACTMEDGFSYTFTSEDGKVTLAAGGNDFGESGWGGSINLTVTDDEPDPDSGELGYVTYVVYLRDVEDSTLAFDGQSMSFSGPMWKQIPGGSFPGDDAGTGTVSVTCT